MTSMISRRRFLAGVAAGVLADAPLAAGAQQAGRVYRRRVPARRAGPGRGGHQREDGEGTRAHAGGSADRMRDRRNSYAMGTRAGTSARVSGSTDSANCSSETAPSSGRPAGGPNRQVVCSVRPSTVMRISAAGHSSWRPSARATGTRHWGIKPRPSNSGPGRQVNIAPVSTRSFTSTGGASPRGLATRTGYVNVLIVGNCSIRAMMVRPITRSRRQSS